MQNKIDKFQRRFKRIGVFFGDKASRYQFTDTGNCFLFDSASNRGYLACE